MTESGDERRDTPLARELTASIRQHGPISVRDYMARCLTDEVHGYYRHRDAIGRSGDFVTAPEISQTFGELLGLWAAAVWQQMGAPRPIHLIEIGPGRGTLMRDMLRAARVVPAFLDAVDVHLVEISPRLRELQQQALVGTSRAIRWHEHCVDVPPGPTIVIANELLDALPVRQLVRHEDRWRERGVGLDGDGNIAFVLLGHEGTPPATLALPPSIDDGGILELGDFTAVLAPLLGRAQVSPFAALLIDYGHATAAALGDTLQAVRNHAYEHPLTSPGEADMSVQVNFGQLLGQIEAGVGGLSSATAVAVDGPTTQAAFLGRLGIAERTSRLMAANPDAAAALEGGVARLLAPNGMGGRFKALGMRSASLLTLPGFAHVDRPARIT